ncbi:hypothetical protein [Flavobacterium sp. UMI-01]|uniref:hypothetical protein n=1 Tax=Flavobacterium sp. UMI-01 TaxID=1441053 RepID=UPI001C7DC28D|nr:hypothetical protein [Flavobacterium sp. UMI-01]GIZ10063.1 hypothetical protein FUMI01_27890 [Flavobacterium sp. UMI-01]
MITSKEFELAIKIIAEYKLQMDNQLKEILHTTEKINIQEDMRGGMFRVLQKYYKAHYDIKLCWEDLKTMERSLLEKIDFDKMKLIKGCGRISLFNFKKLMVSHSVLKEEDL